MIGAALTIFCVIIVFALRMMVQEAFAVMWQERRERRQMRRHWRELERRKRRA